MDLQNQFISMITTKPKIKRLLLDILYIKKISRKYIKKKINNVVIHQFYYIKNKITIIFPSFVIMPMIAGNLLIISNLTESSS